MNTARTFVLLDVDGVLVHPAGYKAALRVTIDHMAAQMGHPAITLSDDEIAVFEACGITNEWDSGAICTSLLMLAALEQQPALRRATLTETLAAIADAGLAMPRPDFVAAARRLAQHNHDGQVPSALLQDVYTLDTPTTRVFQTLTLGSARFADAYHQPAPFESGSYLAQHDIPLLDPGSHDRLLAWLRTDEHGAVIFTARPSLPPADLPGRAPEGYPPEGELAAELVGLEGVIPLIGQGRVGWLAAQHGRTAPEYIKPAPVQALAAIGAAASGTETAALNAAAALFEHGELSDPLVALAGQRVNVIVFEDSTGGIRATRRAVEILQRAGVEAHFQAVGISPHADKRAALAQETSHIVDDVNQGLALVLDT